jgi:hypothetical protein
MYDKLAIELISVFGLPPVQFVELAASLGFRGISAVLEPLSYNPEHNPHYSLRNVRREMIAAMTAMGSRSNWGKSSSLGRSMRPRMIRSFRATATRGTAGLPALR